MWPMPDNMYRFDICVRHAFVCTIYQNGARSRRCRFVSCALGLRDATCVPCGCARLRLPPRARKKASSGACARVARRSVHNQRQVTTCGTCGGTETSTRTLNSASRHIRLTIGFGLGKDEEAAYFSRAGIDGDMDDETGLNDGGIEDDDGEPQLAQPQGPTNKRKTNNR